MIHLNLKEKALVDSTTGELIRPSCFDVLSQYHSYVCCKGHASYAQAILQRVYDGEKIITKMIESAAKHNIQ